MVMAKEVMPLASTETICPIQTTVNPIIPVRRGLSCACMFISWKRMRLKYCLKMLGKSFRHLLFYFQSLDVLLPPCAFANSPRHSHFHGGASQRFMQIN